MEKARRRIAKAKAKQATKLDLSFLDLTELPPELWELTHLKGLDCCGNRLAALDGLGKLTHLTELDCEGNQLAALDGEQLDALSKIAKLSCDDDVTVRVRIAKAKAKQAEMMLAMFEMMWRLSVVDIESTLRSACHKVLYDHSVDVSERLKRAQAMRIVLCLCIFAAVALLLLL